MRSLLEKNSSEKRRKRNVIILSIILLSVMVVSTLGFAFVSKTDSEKEQAGEFYALEIRGQTFYLKNSPENVGDVNVSISATLNNYLGNIVYIDSENSQVNYEISSVLGGYLQRIQLACYGDCEKDLPEKNCSENLIVFRENEKNKVYQDENCIFIGGDLRSVDAFLYRLLGVN